MTIEGSKVIRIRDFRPFSWKASCKAGLTVGNLRCPSVVRHFIRTALSYKVYVMFVIFVLVSAHIAGAQASTSEVIKPGEVWLDDRGLEIQAHGGDILQKGETFYWFGEDRSQTNDSNLRYIACYASTDLVHWKFISRPLILSDPENLGAGWILERPKIFFSSKSGKYVLYAHLDKSDYSYARVAVAVSDKIEGPYKYVKSFRPLGMESRDIGRFVDDNGDAFIIFESRPSGGFYIASLSDDRMRVQKQVAFIHVPLEGGAIVHLGKLYYVIGSHLTGWHPNPNVFATASSLAGPWSDMKDVAPPETNTFDSQSGMLIRVVGRSGTVVIYAGDRWKPDALWDSRYIWLPVKIGNGEFRLQAPKPWALDVKNGRAFSISGGATPKHSPETVEGERR